MIASTGSAACCSGSRTAQTRCGQRQQRPQELRGILRLLHAHDEMRPAGPTRPADAPPARRRRRGCGRRPATAPSPAAAAPPDARVRRCNRAGHSAWAMPAGAVRAGRRRAGQPSRCRRCPAGTGPSRDGVGRFDLAGGVAYSAGRRPCRRCPSPGRAAAPARPARCGVVQQDAAHLRRLRTDHHRHVRLHDPGLLAGDDLHRRSQQFAMIQRDRRDRARRRARRSRWSHRRDRQGRPPARTDRPASRRTGRRRRR